MKRKMNFWLLAALLCGMSLSVTSCKDDDKDNSNGVDPELVEGLTDTDEAKAALNWLANMTDIEEFTDDWALKTYEPTIGMASQNQDNTRVVVVADIDYAKMNFASISGIDIDQLSVTQSQTIDGVGTVTWTPSAEGASNLATVNVNTPLIPHLSKIVYCTADQVGDNGGYDGTAYYRFGDVIEDIQGYYWVCVKPAFGTGRAPQQQGYWINIFNRDPTNGKSKNGKGEVPPIPKANIKSKWDRDYNNNTILLPTELLSTKEQVHNLSNLVWALMDPDAYYKAAGDNGIGLGGYDYKYNGKTFCTRVAKQWRERKIWEKLFNRTYDQMKQFKRLNFFYEGYRWSVGSTGRVTLQTTNKYSNSYLTAFDVDKNWTIELKEAGAGFDIRRYCSDPLQDDRCSKSGKAGYAPAEQFTSDDGYWVVRQKTSSQIAGTILHPSVYAVLNNTSEIYRYNQAFNIASGNKTPVETELQTPTEYKNRGFYNIGDVVEDENHNKWFCMQISSFGTAQDISQTRYAYFVSLNRNAYGENGEKLPTKNLLAQMLFNMETLFHNGTFSVNIPEDATQMRLNNIEQNADVSLYELFATRDIKIQTTKYGEQTVKCSFANAVYRDDNDKLCILRLIGDYTEEDSNGNRDVAWRFWDRYTADPAHTMELGELNDQKIISQYADDKWVYLPWHDPKTDAIINSTGKRLPEDDMINELRWIYYVHGNSVYKGNMATNMYKEPLFTLTVKRVEDVGKPSEAFVDGTKYTHFSLMSQYGIEFSSDDPNNSAAKYGYYSRYLNLGKITLNGSKYDFGLDNHIPR